MLRRVNSRAIPGFAALRRISRILWVRVALMTALAALAALSAGLVDRFLPDGPKDRFSASAILPILTILANGMLAVATFSLGVMVSSHRTLAEQSTPRIHRLLMEDTSTQSMLATFIGAFVFSLLAIILFRANYYDESAAVAVFAATMVVVLAIVVSLVRWIGQLTKIGSLEYALDQAESAAEETLREMVARPALGGAAWEGDGVAAEARPIRARASGFLTRVHMEGLQQAAAEKDAEIMLDVRPGDRLLEGQVLGHASPALDPEPLADCFVLEASRSVDQDPRYALIILREAASKALSPGINDQGTAIEVIARLERLLWAYRARDGGENGAGEAPLFPNVRVRTLPAGTLAIYAFRILARDGATNTEVLTTLTEALARLSDILPEETVSALLHDIHDHAEAGLTTRREKERLSAALKRAGFEEGSL